MKKILPFLFALGLLTGPTFGQQASQAEASEYEFRFVPADDMFYIPWNGNGETLARLLDCVARHKQAILDGSIPVRVDGYCNSQSSPSENLAMAKIRSNRVKTEMILQQGLTEACFTTRNHTTDGNFVIVRIVVSEEPAPAVKPQTEPAQSEPASLPKETPEEAPEETPAPAASDNDTAELTPVAEAPVAEPVDEAETPREMSFALRTNLLRWATLTPDLGIEWRISPSVAIAVNGSWTSWSWNDKERRYALWEVAPEVRWYLGAQKRGYLGAMFKTGEFNYKLSDTGKQGDILGGGVTGGYVLPLCRSLSMDFSIGVGYLNADYENYKVINGVRVRQASTTKEWWGPVNAGVSLVWKLF